MSSRRALFICACLGLLTFGIVLTVLGTVLPAVMPRYGIDKAEAGALFTLMTFGILVGSLVCGPIVDRYGYKGILIASTALTVAGLEGIAFAPTTGWLRLAVILIGFGGGVINGGTNALVADISAESRGAGLSFLAVFFAVGAMGVPFVLGVLPAEISYSVVIAWVGVLVLIPLLVIALTRFPEPKQAQGFPIADAGKLIRDPVFLLMGLMLFLESGMEITVGGWTSTFFNEELAVPARTALIFLSLYWMGMMLARLSLGVILPRIQAIRVLYACIVAGLVGAALLLTTRSPGVAGLGVFLLGVGFAAMFPVVLGFIGDRYATLSGTAFGVAIAMALVGGMLFPYVAGFLGERQGMRASLLIVPACLLTLMALLGVLSRKLRGATSV
ncbi:MAG: MFS transporter [Gemmatimonadota bacterium]|nr:MFS transporter [Gemmatimonadota bacterium]